MEEKTRVGSGAPACKEPDLGELFISYLAGHVTADERARIESHLPHCQECQEELRFFETLKEVHKERSAAASPANKEG